MATLTVIGSADAFASGGRGNSCYLVEDAAGAFMVDFGPTALQGCKQAGREPARDLDAVLITHLHGDHFAGLPFLYIDALFRIGRDRPLDLLGPPGVGERAEALSKVVYPDIPAEDRGYRVEYRELSPGEERVFAGGRKVRAFRAFHQSPPNVALILRVETAGGGVVAFSGDTGWTDALPEACRGADLAVVECSLWHPVYDKHLSWEELRERTPRLGARKVVLAHLGDEPIARAAEMEASGLVQVARDGLAIEFP